MLAGQRSCHLTLNYKKPLWLDAVTFFVGITDFGQIFAAAKTSPGFYTGSLNIMEKDKKKTKFVYQPEFPGGPKELTKFVYANLRYPKEALEANIEGTVYLEYDIDHKGTVVGTRVLKGLGHGCDEEAVRVAKLLKFDVARNRGIHVLFHQKLRVQFKKVKEKPVKPPVVTEMQVSYTMTPTAAPKPEEKPKTETTYSYTIKM